MSGHSHYSTIKRKKEAEDKKRSKIFSKMTRVIILAAKDGTDPATNTKLKNAIEEAKKADVPKNLIEKAIKKGSGELSGEKLEPFVFEAYGPNNVSLIIEGITDNKNRALGDIKKILNKNKGKLVKEGTIKWRFEQKGVILTKPKEKEKTELEAIEAGAEDLIWKDDFLKVFTKPEDFEKVKAKLENIENSSLDWVSEEKIASNKEIDSLLEALLDNDDVQKVYSNT